MNNEELNIGIIVTARVNSNRLHQKVLQEINGKKTIEILLDHLANDKYQVVMAIPKSADDDILADIAFSKGVEVYRGQDDSPLHRLYECAKDNCFDHIVRITADDILIDLSLLFLQVDFHIKGNRDYTFMSRCPEGVAGEVFSFKALKTIVNDIGDKPIEFTSYYVKRPDLNWIEYYPPFEYQFSYRLTMDYEEDLTLLRVLFTLLKNPGTLDIINLIKQNKYLLQINHLPYITVFTPVYNTEDYVIETIQSIVNQTFKDYEYIIVDDGSTDKSCQKIIEYISQLHYSDQKRIKFIRNSKNEGQAYSSNLALEMAKGKYIMCIDSDDVLKPDSLQTMHDILEQEYTDCILTGYDRIDEKGEYIETVLDNDIHLGCALIRTRIINELKYKNGIRYKIGTEFLERLKQNSSINYLKDSLWCYRFRPNQLTQEKEHPDNI